MISHNSDTIINESYKLYAEHPLLVHWYTQNLNFDHNKISILPIGVANTQWNHGKRELFENIKPIDFKSKPNMLYFQFSCHTNAAERNICKSKLEKYFTFSECTSQVEYLNRINSSKFVVSPPGNGIDAHRLWEARMNK